MRILAVLLVGALGFMHPAVGRADSSIRGFAVGPQYDAAHVYVAPQDVDRFAACFLAIFGGASSKPVATTVTPTPSRATSQLLRTPAGTISLFGFTTPIPYPFGAERVGYMVTDLDEAIKAARAAGADVIVAPFADPIGRDAILQWPGGLTMQLYEHFTKSTYPALEAVPETRVYLSADRVDVFVGDFLAFSQGRVVSDEPRAPGVEIGRAGETYRRLRLESGFGKMTLLVTDGHLPYPYGREGTGYEVANLADTIAKARFAGAKVLVEPYRTEGRDAAVFLFPGGYVAEIHALVGG